jgi:ABC-type lipoprotein export system ATPase subunit
MTPPLVLCENLVKIYKVADLEVVALQGLDLEVQPGEMVAIMGASGSGKSTLLNVLSGLDVPHAGRCIVANHDVTQLTPARRLYYRRHVVGYLWQQSGRNLIPHYTLAQNLDVPLWAGEIAGQARRKRISALLEGVGLAGMEHKYPNQLSGGEQQRAGLAVAVAGRPAVLLADEPTGELDSITARQIIQLVRQLQEQSPLTVILVTHDSAIAALADRVVALRDGRTSTETRRRANADGAPTEEDLLALAELTSATHDELIVVDRVGRLQLPRDVLETLIVTGRIQLRRASDHVELWPYHAPTSDQQAQEEAE